MPMRAMFSVLLALVAVVPSEACSVCMGASGLTADATNNAIFFMLGTLFLVFGGIIAVGVSIVRRSRMAIPEYVEASSLSK